MLTKLRAAPERQIPGFVHANATVMKVCIVVGVVLESRLSPSPR
jgi:hypothetical protein